MFLFNCAEFAGDICFCTNFALCKTGLSQQNLELKMRVGMQWLYKIVYLALNKESVLSLVGFINKLCCIKHPALSQSPRCKNQLLVRHFVVKNSS